ncbi:ATP-binding cassette domain-containing protein [Salinibacterium hongtaonis]|uniref:ATP-binding cassette domain-containing protein n=1 Tax=Homoserinimonas hongtaonis TaxID=2079791 RepID=UPI0030CB67B5
MLIADEPTTALDVTIQAQILDLLAELRRGGTGLLLISHDLAVVRSVADRVAVMHDGVIVEQGRTDEVLSSPRHEYTRRLLRSVPSGAARGERLSESLTITERAPAPQSHEPVALMSASGLIKRFGSFTAVDGVSLHLESGRTLGLVGESGSGKTTVARMLLGLTEPDSGSVSLLGSPFSSVPERERRHRRPALGAIYQDALSSFDPRATVADILRDAAGGGSARGVSGRRIADLLDSVGLPSDVLTRRPLHLSGGQRQRVAIARALAPSPRIIVCDEPVSALDVSVQAQVLDLLDDLQRERGLAYLFISHDLGVVHHMSDRVAVMQGGRIVEQGEAAEIFARPTHPYTQTLLAAAPTIGEPRGHLDRSTL